VAEDTPENLTRQLKGASSVYLQVEADGDVEAALAGVPGVQRVHEVDRHERETGYEVETEPDIDIRRDLARAVVDRGWGLLELRPNRMSLEEVFLQLTTTEERGAAAADPGGDDAEAAEAPAPATTDETPSGEAERG